MYSSAYTGLTPLGYLSLSDREPWFELNVAVEQWLHSVCCCPYCAWTGESELIKKLQHQYCGMVPELPSNKTSYPMRTEEILVSVDSENIIPPLLLGSWWAARTGPIPLCPWRWHQLTVLHSSTLCLTATQGSVEVLGGFEMKDWRALSRGFYKRDEWVVNSTGGAGILVQRSKAGSVAVKNSDNWWQCVLSLICSSQSAARAVIYSEQIAVSWKFDQASKLSLSQWRALPSAGIHLLLMWNTQSAKLVCSFLEFWSADMLSGEVLWSMMIAAGKARERV